MRKDHNDEVEGQQKIFLVVCGTNRKEVKNPVSHVGVQESRSGLCLIYLIDS